MSSSLALRRIPILQIVWHIRLTEPWRYKAPFLISVVYFFLLAAAVPFADSLLAVGCALCTTAGIASIGYLSNDLSDRDSDRKAGKPNCTLLLSQRQIALLFALAGAAAVLPWVIFVPVDRIWVSLLVAEFVLFTAYVARPLRLKERGLFGPLTDALYAHANPALLAGYIMYRLTGDSYRHPMWLLSTLFLWQFFLGLRNILEHQLSDAENDRIGGTRTYVTRTGEDTAAGLLRAIVIPLELAGFCLYITLVSLTLPAIGIAFLLHLTVTALIIRCYASRFLAGSLHERLALFVDDFSLGWMPLVILAGLAWTDWRFSVLLLLHVVVFQSRLLPLVTFLQRAARDALLQARMPHRTRRPLRAKENL